MSTIDEKWLGDRRVKYPLKWDVMYGGLADTWQRDEDRLKNADRKWLHDNLQEPVLDIGCGSGVDGEAFAQYVGVDIAPSFLKAAKKHGVENVLCADGRLLPFRDKSFKTSFIREVLLHYLEADGFRFINEAIRVAENTYISWGLLPQNKRKINMQPDTFFYNTYSLKELSKHFVLSFIKDTTITKVSKK